jgi:hypothetical protein
MGSNQRKRAFSTNALQADCCRMGQLNSRMKKWGLDVYKSQQPHSSSTSYRTEMDSAAPPKKHSGMKAVSSVAQENRPHIVHKDGFPIRAPRARNSKSLSGTTSVLSLHSSGRSSSGTLVSISSASSVVQDDASPGHDDRNGLACTQEPISNAVGTRNAIGVTDCLTNRSRTHTQRKLDVHHPQVVSASIGWPPLPLVKTVRSDSMEYSQPDVAKNAPKPISDTSGLDNPMMPPLEFEQYDSFAGTNQTSITETQPESAQTFPPGWCVLLQPFDALMINTMADCLFASKRYQEAFEHYYFLVKRFETEPSYDLEPRIKAVYNCARSYVTEDQAHKAKSLLVDCLELLQHHRARIPINGRLAEAIAHLFLAEFKDEKECDYKKEVEYVVANHLQVGSFSLSIDQELFRENLGLTARLQQISDIAIATFNFKERALAASKFVENAARSVAPYLLWWCANYIRREQAQIDTLLRKSTEHTSNFHRFKCLFNLFIQAWVSDPIRLECSPNFNDVRLLFNVYSTRGISEFDALSAVTEIIALQDLSEAPLLFDNFDGSASISRSLLRTTNNLLAQPHTASELFAITYMSCITKSRQERQKSPKLDDLELLASFVSPLVSSGLLRLYLAKPTLPNRDNGDTEGGKARHVQFALDLTDHKSEQEDPQWSETLAGSLHSSTNSSFRKFKGLAMRLKDGTSALSVSTKSSKSSNAMSVSTKGSKSSNAMSVDSRVSQPSSQIFQMSSNGSIPETIEEGNKSVEIECVQANSKSRRQRIVSKSESRSIREHYPGPTRPTDPYYHCQADQGIVNSVRTPKESGRPRPSGAVLPRQLDARSYQTAQASTRFPTFSMPLPPRTGMLAGRQIQYSNEICSDGYIRRLHQDIDYAMREREVERREYQVLLRESRLQEYNRIRYW